MATPLASVVRTARRRGSKVRSTGRLAAGILQAIEERFGVVTPVIVKTASEFEAVVRGNPFTAADGSSMPLPCVMRPGAIARGAIRVVATNDWTRRNFARWMFEDEPRAAVFTPKRWHRGFLDREGAY